MGSNIRLIKDVVGIHTAGKKLSKAWKMNGLAFENVNYREIQLTPGARKDAPISAFRRRVGGGVPVDAHNTHGRRKKTVHL